MGPQGRNGHDGYGCCSGGRDRTRRSHLYSIDRLNPTLLLHRNHGIITFSGASMAYFDPYTRRTHRRSHNLLFCYGGQGPRRAGGHAGPDLARRTHTAQGFHSKSPCLGTLHRIGWFGRSGRTYRTGGLCPWLYCGSVATTFGRAHQESRGVWSGRGHCSHIQCPYCRCGLFSRIVNE